MSAIAIRAEGLAKRYRIGERRAAYGTLRDTLSAAASSPVRRMSALLRGEATSPRESEVWALKDVTFEVERGDVVAVIGRNGAGKTTLLRVLSRITEPTGGFADVHGRVGSLLEVGAGFHQELTGRENIFLSGAILGMRKDEIRRKFDDIVEFAEVERFIDTPVKHYSSGMYLRLAFAVAAHLEPEILLIDEVLAVGDVAFQRKCLGKMDDVARQGRTVLFVSHNMGSVRALCGKGIYLEDGRVAHAGPVERSIEAYYRAVGAMAGHAATTDGGRFGPLAVNAGGNTVGQGEPFEVRTELYPPPGVTGFTLSCLIEDMHGRLVVALREESAALGCAGAASEPHAVAVRFPPLWLNAGLYALYFRVKFRGDLQARGGLSDKFPLDVRGDSGPMEALLQPAVHWSLRPRRES